MFELIHKHKRIAAIVIAVASISFIFWLFTVQDIKQMFGLKRCVAVVGDSCITIREFRYNLILAGSFSIDNKESRKILIDQVLTGIIQREILMQKSKYIGALASSNEVMDVVTSDPNFLEGKEFSVKKYSEFIERLGLTPEEYEDILREEISVRKFLNVFSKTNYFTAEEQEFIDRIAKTVYNGEAYIIRKSEIIKKIRISENEITDYYNKNRDNFKTNERVIVRIWKISEKGKALKLYNDLKKGTTNEGGNFTEKVVTKDELKRDETLSKLSLASRVYIEKEGSNYIIYYLHSVTPPVIRPLKDVRAEIEKILRERKANEILSKEVMRIKKQLNENKQVDVKAIKFNNSGIDEFIKLFRLSNVDIIELTFSKLKVFGPYMSGNNYIILKIAERKLADSYNNSTTLNQLFVRSKVESLVSLYMDKVLRKEKIDVNEEYLDKLQ